MNKFSSMVVPTLFGRLNREMCEVLRYFFVRNHLYLVLLTC